MNTLEARDDGLLTVQEAAERLRVSPRTVRRMAANRELRHLRVGRLIRLYGSDMDGFIAKSIVDEG